MIFPKASEYDLDIPQSQTTDQPMALRKKILKLLNFSQGLYFNKTYGCQV